MKTTVAEQPSSQGTITKESQKSFYNGRPSDPVPPRAELETKEVWNFPRSADSFKGDMNLDYALEIVLKTLHAEGFSVSERKSKNLSSDYFDTLERDLNKLGISLRMRYNEESKKINCPEAERYNRADLSFKFPTNPNDPHNTENRDEREAETDIIIDENGVPQFVITFEKLIDKHVAEILEETSDPKQAVAWARQVHDTFNGFDWSQFQEHFSINCKRSQPYVTLYSVEDSAGHVITKDGIVEIHKDRPADLPPHHKVREIVYQFCLDTNRFFTEDPQGSNNFVKIKTDHEVEFELQQRDDDYTPDAIASTKGVTWGEAYAARVILKNLLHKIRKNHDISLDDLSGKSKQYRGFDYVDDYHATKNANVVFVPKFAIRGREDMVINKAHTWEEMVNASPALKEAVTAMNDNRKPNLHHLKRNVA